jgi:hypothetical protein
MVAMVTILWAAVTASGMLIQFPFDSLGPVESTARHRVEARMIVLPDGADAIGRWQAAIVARFAHDTLGTPWPRWIDVAHPHDCEAYRASSYVPLEDVFWVYRCREPAEVGHQEAECFLLEQDSVPTLERTRWSAGRACGLGHAQIGGLADSLARELAAELGEELRLQRRDILGARYGAWTLIAELATPWGRLRLLRGADPETRDSLILEHTSRRLEEALARSEREGSPYEPEEPSSADSLREVRERAEVARALRSSAPQFAQALSVFPSRATDAGVVGAAIADAGRALSSSSSDLVSWAGHLWGMGLNLGPEDTLAVRRVNEVMGPAGGRCIQLPDGQWCWEDSLAERLATRAGDNAWTEHAFLELMERGLQSHCALCGWDPRVGSDLFRPTIECGEAFLREHGNSPIARAVRWLVAEAHETAWSLSKAELADEYIEWTRYVLDAPEHRARAIELYEFLLRGEPAGPRRSAVLNRLRRLRLDVDTGFHRFWCVWD